MLLFAASAVSVRAARAENGEAPEEAAAACCAADVLCSACVLTQEGRGDAPEATAAYAAELLRYEAGLVSSTSRTGVRMPAERLGDAFLAANRASANGLSIELTDWLASIQPFDAGIYDNFAAHAEAFRSLGESMEDALKRAARAAADVLSRDLRGLGIPLYASAPPSFDFGWKEWAALYRAFGVDMPAMLAACVRVECGGDMAQGVTIDWTIPSFEEAARQGTGGERMEAKLALAYFNTIYDADGAFSPIEADAYPEEFLSALAHPLPGRIIKNGWGDPRSRRTRLHMGTDILAPARSPIRAATGGVVVCIGYLPIPGNYVVILDALGYEYHYYHLNEITTYVAEGERVEQGQIIGRVGNTGNSAAYHLHLGIVSPEYAYLNPYDVLRQAGLGPILPD